MSYGSPFYLLMLAFCIISAVALYFILRQRSEKTKRIVIISIALVNLAQHLLKSIVYPMLYSGWGFNLLNTAYNMCALLIILTPLALFVKNRHFRDFIFLASSFAGIVAIALPYWYIGQPVASLGWDYARFYICHILLFLTGSLSLALGVHKVRFSAAPKIGLGFLISVCLILLNDTVCALLGIVEGIPKGNVSAALNALNPVWSMGPSPSFEWVVGIIKALSPNIFFPDDAGRGYTPVLWYAIPVYIGITLLSLAALSIIDPRGAKRFFKSLSRKSKTKE